MINRKKIQLRADPHDELQLKIEPTNRLIHFKVKKLITIIIYALNRENKNIFNNCMKLNFILYSYMVSFTLIIHVMVVKY